MGLRADNAVRPLRPPVDGRPDLCPTKRPFLGSVRFPNLVDALWG